MPCLGRASVAGLTWECAARTLSADFGLRTRVVGATYSELERNNIIDPSYTDCDVACDVACDADGPCA